MMLPNNSKSPDFFSCSRIVSTLYLFDTRVLSGLHI